MKVSFTKETPVRLDSSLRGFHKEKKKATMQFNIKVNDAKNYGSFECYDVDDCETYYAEGGLWFVNKELVDYDGVFELPSQILDYLEDNGYDVKHMKEALNES